MLLKLGVVVFFLELKELFFGVQAFDALLINELIQSLNCVTTKCVLWSILLELLGANFFAALNWLLKNVFDSLSSVVLRTSFLFEFLHENVKQNLGFTFVVSLHTKFIRRLGLNGSRVIYV